jgi:endonuclease G
VGGEPDEVKWLANEGIRVSAIYHCLEEQRFTSKGGGAALAQLERGIGVTPLLPQPAEAQVALEADRKPLPLSAWEGTQSKLGYDPKFLSVELPLDKIIGGQKAAAAMLENSTAVALHYLHFSVVIHEKRRFAMLTSVNIAGDRLTNPGARSDTWRQDLRIAPKYQPAGDFYEGSKGDDKVTFSRGHLVRRIDPCWGTLEEAKLAEIHTFHYSNATPQVQHYNDVDWGNLEDYILAQLQTKEKGLPSSPARSSATTIRSTARSGRVDPGRSRSATGKSRSSRRPRKLWPRQLVSSGRRSM